MDALAAKELFARHLTVAVVEVLEHRVEPYEPVHAEQHPGELNSSLDRARAEPAHPNLLGTVLQQRRLPVAPERDGSLAARDGAAQQHLRAVCLGRLARQRLDALANEHLDGVGCDCCFFSKCRLLILLDAWGSGRCGSAVTPQTGVGHSAIDIEERLHEPRYKVVRPGS